MSVYLTLLEARSIQAPTPSIPRRIARARAKTGTTGGANGGGKGAMTATAVPCPGLYYVRAA